MNGILATSPFLANLRTATSESHTALEELPVSKSIMNPNVSKEEYILYLTLMHDVVKDAESEVFPKLSGIIPEISEMNKTQFIEEDLKYLGQNKKAEFLKPISSKLNNPSIGFMLGILYVIEGSSLGGRVILKNINKALGYDIDNGAAYFAGYGTNTGNHWKNFLKVLAEYEAETGSSEEIIKGAAFAFDAINSHFTTNASN